MDDQRDEGKGATLFLSIYMIAIVIPEDVLYGENKGEYFTRGSNTVIYNILNKNIFKDRTGVKR